MNQTWEPFEVEQLIELQRQTVQFQSLMLEGMRNTSLVPERDRAVENPLVRCVNCGLVGSVDTFYRGDDEYACIDPVACQERQKQT